TSLALPRTAGPVARTFVVVTDGYVTVEAEAFALVRERLDAANLFAFGIGSSVNRHLIEGLARAGQGEPFIVTSSEDAAAGARRFRTYIESPLLTGVRLSADGVDIAETTPGALADLFAQRPVVVFGKWRGEPAGRLRLTGTSGCGTFEQVLDFSTAASLGSSRALELLWARSRLRALADDEMEGSAAERVTAITHLGLTHGLLTSHTSFVAVDERVRQPGGGPTPVDQPSAMPAGVESSESSGYAVATTPEPATLGVLALTLLALGWTWWRSRRDAAREVA
ncbi:MAG: PEP-CTERM sorting domain-containing protein, partial [Vicinamibacteria bacterium]